MKINKKIKKVVLLISLAFIFFALAYPTKAITCPPPYTLVDGVCTAPAGQQYYLLAPLPNPEGGTLQNIDVGSPNALGQYLNIIIKLAIGIAAVLAVVLIVMGGIQYMTTELVSGNEEGKKRITNAVLGLLVALGAYLILFTINPDLLKTELKIETTTIQYTADQANFAQTEQPTTAVGTGFVLPAVNPSITAFATTYGSSLDKIIVNTNNRTATFCAGSNCITVNINVGRGGVAEIGQGVPGDLKTPKGTYNISGDRRISSNGNAVTSGNGYNLGAAFINIGIKDANGNDRGIGFHGSYNNFLAPTNGCIRLDNGALLTLAPYMKAGTQVIIQ